MWSQNVIQRKQKTRMNQGRQIKCQRTGTRAQQTRQPTNKNYENTKLRNSETRHTNDTRRTLTCWRGADDCCTDDATRRREIHRDKQGEKKKVGSKEKTQENRTQGVHSNKASRLCYKAEPGTLSHHLPSSYSRRQRYQVSLLSL